MKHMPKRPDLKDYNYQFGDSEYEIDMANYIGQLEKGVNPVYISSIIHKYGDTDNVKTDVATLGEIFRRQGSQLLIDVIAEMTATECNKFKLSNSDRIMTMISLVDSLEEALKERL